MKEVKNIEIKFELLSKMTTQERNIEIIKQHEDSPGAAGILQDIHWIAAEVLIVSTVKTHTHMHVLLNFIYQLVAIL